MWRLIQLLNCTIFIWFESQLYTTYSCNTTTRLLHHLWHWITMHWSELLFEEMFSNRTSVNFNWTSLLQTESGCDGWIIDGWMDGAWHGLQIQDLAVNDFRWILNVTLTTRWCWDVLNMTYNDNYKVLKQKTSIMDSHERLLHSDKLYFIGISWKIDCATQRDT